MTEQPGQLEEEIESWKGFPWALRKEDRELWDAMIKEVRDDFGDAVERSGTTLTTDPLFMALLLTPANNNQGQACDYSYTVTFGDQGSLWYLRTYPGHAQAGCTAGGW